MKHTLVACTALRAFTEFVPNYGQVHGDPNNRQAKRIRVPEQVVDKLVDEKKVAVAQPRASKGNDEPRSTDGAEPGAYTATYKPVGKYEITGPGLTEPLVITGNKDAAAAKIAELTAGADAADEGGAPAE